LSKLWEKTYPDSIKDSIRGGELWSKEIFLQKINTCIKAPARSQKVAIWPKESKRAMKKLKESCEKQ